MVYVLRNMFVVFGSLILSACAPTVVAPANSSSTRNINSSSVSINYIRNYKSIDVNRAANYKLDAPTLVAAYTAHEYVIVNNFAAAKKITVVLASPKGVIDARLNADILFDGRKKSSWEDLSDNEVKGVTIADPTSKKWYFYALNRTQNAAKYNVVVTAE